MNLNSYFKSIVDSDPAPVVICNLEHTVVYMNPAAIARYKVDLTGASIKLCHNAESNKEIDRIASRFALNKDNDIVFTYHSEKENKDVYMVALRDDTGALIGYYEKHEYRNRDHIDS